MMKSDPKYIIVGASGGVDSSVAAYLLKQAGHHVTAVFMKNWEDDGEYCSSATDLLDAQKVCDILDIELTCVNFADEYWQHVFSHFLDEYAKGRTPNPDILCNKEIKFKAFLNYAKRRGADCIATGHYVRKRGASTLLKGIDPEKDQSYFLYALDQSQLSSSLFPVGDLLKQEVRALAKSLGLCNHQKKDSTGICFIGERKFKSFLTNYLPAQPGNIETIEGKCIGKHAGLMFYTIGQRQGLQIGGKATYAELPWYVVDKNVKENVLIVAQGDHAALYKTSVYVSGMHWIHEPLPLPLELYAKVRYRQKDQACVLSLSKSRPSLHKVTFEKPQRALAQGQSIVFYQGDICLGGGIIE